MAHDALIKVRARLPGHPKFDPDARVLDEPSLSASLPESLNPATRLRLLGRYGSDASQVTAYAQNGELSSIATTPILWAELRWAARAEGVVHLDDLLLRRVRLGLLLPDGGLDCMSQIRSIVQPELGWDNGRWEKEVQEYAHLWKKSYSIR
jgi:glycerol-3-phosphate dehydrogenase